MSNVGLALFIATWIVVIFIGLSALMRPVLAISALIATLPILNLVQKAFPEKAMPFPSPETIAIAALFCGVIFGACMRLHLSSDSTSLRKVGLLLLSIFIFFSLLSTVYSEEWWISARILLAGGIAPCICYFLASKYVRTPEDYTRLVSGISIMVIITGLYTLMNYFNRSGQLGGSFDSGAYRWIYTKAPIVNIFTVPSAAVAAMLPTLPLALWYGRYGGRFRFPIMIAASSLCLVISLFSFSRGSWIATVITGMISFLLLYKGRRFRTAIMLTIFLSIGLYYSFDKIAKPILESRVKTDAVYGKKNVEGRAANYLLSLRAGVHHPFIGVGLGNYPAIYREFPEGRKQYVWFAHNLVLTLIPEVGAFAAAIFVVFLLIHIFNAFKCRGEAKDVELCYAIGVGLLGFLTVASTSGCHLVSSLRTPAEMTYFSAPAMIVVFTLMGVIAGRANASKIITDTQIT